MVDQAMMQLSSDCVEIGFHHACKHHLYLMGVAMHHDIDDVYDTVL